MSQSSHLASCTASYFMFVMDFIQYKLQNTRVKPYKESSLVNMRAGAWDGLAEMCLPQYIMLSSFFFLQIIIFPNIDPKLLDSQCGFQKGCGTTEQIWVTRQIIDRAVEYEMTAHCVSISHQGL